MKAIRKGPGALRRCCWLLLQLAGLAANPSTESGDEVKNRRKPPWNKVGAGFRLESLAGCNRDLLEVEPKKRTSKPMQGGVKQRDQAAGCKRARSGVTCVHCTLSRDGTRCPRVVM